MKKLTLILLSFILSGPVLAQHSRSYRFEKVAVRPFDMGRNIGNEPQSQAAPVQPLAIPGNRALLKTNFSSSLNVNGLFSYEERYLTVQQAPGLFIFGNRAGGVFGNTGNDLKFKFTDNQGATWDSVVLTATGNRNYRYPSMITYHNNPAKSAGVLDIYGIVSGPIYETAWTSQYCGSVRLDGQFEDITYIPNEPTVYLNHLNIDLFCSPDGHVTVASQRLNGTTGSYTFHGWEVLNGSFNATARKFDWQIPLLKVQPALKEAGRIDASRIAWSVDGSVGYLFGTAIDSSAAYNPYGVEWPVIYKSTDHGATWVKTPAFDFSTIPLFQSWLWPTVADTTKIIPRWYNKWASDQNQGENGALVDIYGNLHIFGLLRGTMSVHPDSLNYFYTAEPMHMFDVYMKNGGGWDAIYIDSLLTVNPPDPGTYGITWDHQTQITRNSDGSKLFYVWTDTDPIFASENVNPDIKGKGYNAVTGMATPVKNFTASSPYWLQNWWMRVADQVFYDGTTHTSMLPFTTSIPGAINEDPLVHEYLTGCEIADNEFTLLVGQKEIAKKGTVSPVSANYPNPFREFTILKVSLEKPAAVVVKIINLTGQTVETIDHGVLPAGLTPVMISEQGLTSGIYFYTVLIDGKSYAGKMMVK